MLTHLLSSCLALGEFITLSELVSFLVKARYCHYYFKHYASREGVYLVWYPADLWKDDKGSLPFSCYIKHTQYFLL